MVFVIRAKVAAATDVEELRAFLVRSKLEHPTIDESVRHRTDGPRDDAVSVQVTVTMVPTVEKVVAILMRSAHPSVITIHRRER